MSSQAARLKRKAAATGEGPARKIRVKPERDPSPLFMPEHAQRHGSTNEDPIDLDDLETKIELPGKIWVTPEELDNKIKEECARLFRSVSREAKGNPELSLRIHELAQLAATWDLALISVQSKKWLGVLHKAVEAREKDVQHYEEFMENIHPDHKAGFQSFLDETLAREANANETVRRFKGFMKVWARVNPKG